MSLTREQTLAAGTVIALAMATLFVLGSPGRALVVTFVPGVAMAWLVFLRLTLTARPLPGPRPFLIWFGIALAIQFLHFAEEYATEFPFMFGPLYGGEPIEPTIFVGFNMASYAVFLVAALLVAFGGLAPLLIPALFFAVYGVAGNAVAHLLWAVAVDGYFSGLFTSLAYWVVALPLLCSFGLTRKEAAVTLVAFALILLATAGLSMNLAAIGV